MKGPWKFAILLTAVVVVACTKEWPARKLASLRSKGNALGDRTVYASEWTTINNWERGRKGFYADQKLQVKANKGKVLLFARKLWAADQTDDTTDMPLQLPLQFLPYTDQPGLTENWQYELSEDKLRVNLEVTGVPTPAPREVAVRYVVIPEKIWADLASKEPDVDNLAYDDLVAKLEINP